MKKYIGLFLALALAFAALPASAAPAPDLTFAVASDLHYNLPEESLTQLTDDPVFGYANRRAAMENESGFIIDAFLADCAAKKADCVLLSGDLADNGRSLPEEHYAVRDKLLAFEQAAGIEVYVINGNHDLGAGSKTDIADFKEIYKDLGYDHALSARAEDCSYTADLGAKYRLIALDSCDPTVSTEDGMSAAKIAWVLKEAKAAKAAGRATILMMHHNLLEHLPAQRIISHNFIVRAHNTTAELFADAGIRVVLTGHEHCSDAAAFTSAAGNELYDFATTSLTMYPLAYRLFCCTDEKISYTAQNIEKIDTAALSAAVRGYTPRQLELMEADLNAYAKRFLKKGVQYRLTLQLDAEKSGLKQGGALYNLLDTVYGKLRELLEMPLYGPGSAAEVAASYHIELPVTPYETGWDLATEFVAAHYEGSESFDLRGPEITALLRLASVVLKYVPDGAVNSLLADAPDWLASALTLAPVKEACRSAFGGVTPGEVFVAALVSDLVYGFTSDTDIDDNNGAIPGYGQTDRAAALGNKFKAFVQKLITVLKNFIAVLTRR